ncbi:PDR/VanB family oxidoreductase [Pseudonocardia sulfidoxydans]|uniref:PDR/VanB family oxidoreductase n=1 Tax=Pseudonocardia sulfidoxydans TaxID=54011 RepID=UPI00362193EE
MRVEAKEQVAERVVALTLARPDGGRLPDWQPGAHVDLVLPDGTVRQYSLCGDRFDPARYRVGVLREPAGRGGSRYVHDDLRVGELLGVGGPRNDFPMVPAQRYLFLAGGIGITPLLPMVSQAELIGADWTLVYGGRSRTSMAFVDDLAGHGDRVHLVPEDENGRLDLAAWLDDPRPDVAVYCCGPPGLLDAVVARCRSWPPYSLHTERFVARARSAPARSVPFEVEAARSGVIVTVTADVSVLDALRAAGVDLLSSCRQGTCGTCEAVVLEGVPDHRDSIFDDRRRGPDDPLYPCVSRSCTDRLVLDL